MRDEGLNYGRMMEQALRGVMAEALAEVAANGLPGDHHFYITFAVGHGAVRVPDWLREKYPEQITIVLQHEYDALEVEPAGFRIRLSFSNLPADLYVPFDAVLTFVDPSVEFGLKFDATETEAPEPLETPEEEAPKPSADVVSLDKFRKP
ncbi:MAG: SspB family protein [Pikeienuella sp.]